MRNVAPASWRDSRSRHSLLLQMAKEAEELVAQAERLKQLKSQTRGVTFKKIGEAAGVTERQVQRWFAAESDIGDESIKPLARYFGTTPEYIEYGTVGRPRKAATPALAKVLGDDDLLRRIEQKLDRLLKALTPTTPEQADLMARALLALAPVLEQEQSEPAPAKRVPGRPGKAAEGGAG